MDYPMRDRESREPTTVLDHLRPTVVRRRVVVDVAALKRSKLESPDTNETDTRTEPEATRSSGCYPRANVSPEDDSAPPSSILAPEGYDALDEEEGEPEDGDTVESERAGGVSAGLEEETQAAPPSASEAPAVDPRPSIPVGPTIAVGTIAKRLGLPSAQVAAELVSRGFFEVTSATVLSRDTARIVADAFGRAVEEVAEPERVKPVKVKAPRKRTARRAAPAKRTSKVAKPKKRTGRSTRRAA